MEIEDSKKFDYYCKDVQELLFLYGVWPEETTFDEREETAKHLAKCPECRSEYLKLKPMAPAIRANPQCLVEYGIWKPSQQKSSGQKPTHEEIMQIRFEARLERAYLRRKRRERRERIAMIKRLVKPISAVAACLIAVLGVYLIASYLTPVKDNTPIIAAIPIEIPVKIEFLTASAPKIIPAGQQIIALGAPKTLRINNNRRMTLNPGTELSITPHNLGCIVKLEKGEIDTQVEHDGKPFIVATAHGRAIITGTTFNIKTDDTQMNLKVTEGTVKFESDKGSVNVTAGFTSIIAANSQPTRPVALADFGNTKPPVIVSDAMLEEFDLPMEQAPPVLENIDYHAWVEENRDWFKQQFPQIFTIKDALAREGIEVDYPELLIKSGDLWRFRYPPASSTKLLIPDPAVLTQLAASFGKDQQWLTEILPAINFANNTATSNDIATTNAVMFNKWLTSLQNANFANSNIIMGSLHASIYLTNTRTLTWLTTAQTNPDAKEQNLLDDEIATTYKLTTQIIQLMKYEENNCESDHPKLLQQAIEGINKIIEIERRCDFMDM